MHIKLPEKAEESLRYLRLKFLPKTLFFRTMLLIFIPLSDFRRRVTLRRLKSYFAPI